MSKHQDYDQLVKEMRGRSPVRSSVLMLSILGFIAIAFFWAAVTELDDVTRADGRVVPSGNLQVIEAAETGLLLALHVKEGDVVQAGQLLMELDGSLLSSRLDQEQARAYGLRARIQRLEAEISGGALIFDEALVQQAPDVVKSEAALFQGRLDALMAEIAILENQRIQRQQEYAEVLTELDTARTTLLVLKEERALKEPLVERGIEPQTTLLALRRNEADWEGRRIRAQASLKRFGASLSEIDEQIAAQRQRYQSAALTDLAISTAELSALEPALPMLQERAARAAVKSPVRGIVNRIHRTTIGSTAAAGDELIEIVPLQDETLLVEAYIRPDDRAFLLPGMDVRVKITAYDFARYGALDGKIVRIGADTVQRSERDNEEVFVAEIRTTAAFLDGAGEPVEILPGMIAGVDILAGRKTVLDYITEPVIKVKDNAFRD